MAASSDFVYVDVAKNRYNAAEEENRLGKQAPRPFFCVFRHIDQLHLKTGDTLKSVGWNERLERDFEASISSVSCDRFQSTGF